MYLHILIKKLRRTMLQKRLSLLLYYNINTQAKA